MTRHIYVGIDGSEGAASALRWAVGEAQLGGAVLHVVECYDSPLGDPHSGWGYALTLPPTGGAVTSVEAAAAAVRDEHPELEVVADQSTATPPHALGDGRAPDDLVVVGASGRTGVTGCLLGGTARRIIRRSGCPVAVVPRLERATDPQAGVVVGVDGSAGGWAALCWAVDEAMRRGVELVVVLGFGASTTGDERSAGRAAGASVLEQAVGLVRQRGCPVIGRSSAAPPASALLSAAGTSASVVVGACGRGASSMTRRGSTTGWLVDHCQVPLVVVPAARD